MNDGKTQERGVAPDSALAAGSMCSNCVYWEGIEELGSYIEGTCFAMMRVTGYAETCDEFSPNDLHHLRETNEGE